MWENIGMTEVQQGEVSNLVTKIVDDALEDKPGLKQIPRGDLESLTKDSLVRIGQLEEAGRDLSALLPKTPEEAQRIKAVWVLSGGGTYYKPTKKDSYEKLSWAQSMDRRRLSVGAWIMRKITEIGGNTPYLIYNGRPDENEDLRRALDIEIVPFPSERIYIIDAPIKNTVDQVKTFSLPENLVLSPDDQIAIVTHAPHAVRLSHKINRSKPFPEGVSVKLFPIPTWSEGKQEYAEMEIRGLLYYVFISGEADLQPYPYDL